MFDTLPSFRKIPAYVCGFVETDMEYDDLPYQDKMGRKNYKITGWNGPIRSGDMDKIKKLEGVAGKIQFEGIGNFSHDNGHLFNTGSFKWKKGDWDNIVAKL